MQRNSFKADIVICGAGPAGLSLSLLLARAGLTVALIDAEKPSGPSSRPSGRTAALLNGSVNAVKACGVWKSLAPSSATPLKTMRIIDDGGETRTEIVFQAEETGAPQFGFNVPNAALKAALLDAVGREKNITHFAPRKLLAYTVDGTRIVAETDDGERIEAALIAGTDGRNSVVRKVANIDAETRDYGQTAMTFLVEHTLPHDFTSTEFQRPGGPFTLVPMPGNVSSVVWVEKTEDAKRFLAMKHGDYQQAAQDRSSGILGTLTLASPPESWPLMYLRANDIVSTRAVLAAEAAHVLSPLGAQGLNLSMRDVAVLAETIIDAGRLGEDIGSKTVLTRYKSRRHWDMETRTRGIDGYNRAVASDIAAVRDLKRLGLAAVGNFPPLKDAAMRRGLAPMADGGRILSGGAL